MSSIKRIIVDVDVGTDDYLALMVLFEAEKMGLLQIEAITCSMGNTSLENVCKNTVRFLETIKRTDVPIYKGSSQPLILPKVKVNQFHGDDGFGDLSHDSEPDVSIISNKPSCQAMRDIVLKYPQEVSLICVGALTNVALAIKIFDDFVPNLKELWLMGGNHTGMGNVTSAAEFNFFVDPEAAFIVLECLKCPIYMLPWETCLKSTIDFAWRRTVLGNKSKAWALLSRAEDAVYPKHQIAWCPCDAYLAFAFLNPKEYIIKKSEHHITVELVSSYTRGQVVVDHLREKQPNVTIIEQIDTEKFKQFLILIDL